MTLGVLAPTTRLRQFSLVVPRVAPLERFWYPLTAAREDGCGTTNIKKALTSVIGAPTIVSRRHPEKRRRSAPNVPDRSLVLIVTAPRAQAPTCFHCERVALLPIWALGLIVRRRRT